MNKKLTIVVIIIIALLIVSTAYLIVHNQIKDENFLKGEIRPRNFNESNEGLQDEILSDDSLDLTEQINSATEAVNDIAGEKFEETTQEEKDESTKIVLNGTSITVSGSGVNVKNTIATIISGGTYTLTGNLNDGQIIVNASDNDVTLILNGVNIKSTTTSPIYIEQAKNTTIYLQDGTKNYIEDGSKYIFASPEENEPDATIFSKDDLFITGSGTLNVVSNYNDAIKSKDDFSILNGIINITSVDDGIVGKDSISIKNGVITIKASGDGMKTTNDTDDTKGSISIQNGDFIINTSGDGIQSERDLNISDGTFKITSIGKGIKAINNLTILGGTYDIRSTDDGVHCNNNIAIENGNIKIASNDDGIHADTTLVINNGDITIEKSYEGLESASVVINGGNISVIASDDGINAAGGSDGSSLGGRTGQNNFSKKGNYAILINGGLVNVNAQGDGLDANGSIYISCGVVCVSGPTNNGNSALDYDRECGITGGTLFAAGSSGMLETNFSSNSQCIIMFYGSYSPNQKMELVDEDGNILIGYTIPKTCQSIIISLAEIEKGKTYKLNIDGKEGDSVTISEVVTIVGSNGNNGGIGGRMPGGNRNGGGQIREKIHYGDV